FLAGLADRRDLVAQLLECRPARARAVEHHDEALRARIARDRAQPYDDRGQLAHADVPRQLDALDVIDRAEHGRRAEQRRAHHDRPAGRGRPAALVAQAGPVAGDAEPAERHLETERRADVAALRVEDAGLVDDRQRAALD